MSLYYPPSAFAPAGFGAFGADYPAVWSEATLTYYKKYASAFAAVKNTLAELAAPATMTGNEALMGRVQKGMNLAESGLARLESYKTIYANTQPTIETALLSQWYQDAAAYAAQATKDLAAIQAKQPVEPTVVPSVSVPSGPYGVPAPSQGGPLVGPYVSSGFNIPTWMWVAAGIGAVAYLMPKG